MSQSTIDHEYTDAIVCPYCGHQFRDSWEYTDDSEIACGECDRAFTLRIHTSVTYCTERMPCEGEHRWGDAERADISEQTCADWNERGFLGGKHVPHTLWSRQCAECEDKQYKSGPLGCPNPWAARAPAGSAP